MSWSCCGSRGFMAGSSISLSGVDEATRRMALSMSQASSSQRALTCESDSYLSRGSRPMEKTPCQAKPHFCCKECGCDSFHLETIGYGHLILTALDNEDHRLRGEIDRDFDDSVNSKWRGPWRRYLRCDDCDREIEFGWSHPNRGGRIWPVEASCFNPWKSWPEPRYRKSWQRKGWLHPSRS